VVQHKAPYIRHRRMQGAKLEQLSRLSITNMYPPPHMHVSSSSYAFRVRNLSNCLDSLSPTCITNLNCLSFTNLNCLDSLSLKCVPYLLYHLLYSLHKSSSSMLSSETRAIVSALVSTLAIYQVCRSRSAAGVTNWGLPVYPFILTLTLAAHGGLKE
jgi:hypothetical protein